ncbi:hypothetical protein B0H14DRAFT_2342038, partial [Mycena olivaceomarginata]
IINDVSTNRIHMAKHADIYRAWCTKNNFESKLKEDIKARAEAAEEAATAAKKLQQATLDPHLREKPERVVPYSDALFRQVALEWLIATDQPLDALNHPKFQEMIDIAARATGGVKIPGRKATREEILDLFHQQIEKLRVRTHVSGLYIFCSAAVSTEIWSAE